jgi:hypothetical protein
VSIQSEEFNVYQLRHRLKKMSESELLRFGQAAKFVCRDRNPPEAFLIQLREARAEWRRRHPKLPLNASI